MAGKLDWFVLKWASLGGVIGMIYGSFFVAKLLPPDILKMTFTVMASSFAVVLIINYKKEQRKNSCIWLRGGIEKLIFILTGILGGIISSMLGTGIDIITFIIMVLLFRVDEKTATPTTVILMALNSVIGLLLHGFVMNDINETVFGYWMAALPVVVVGAPLGAILCSWFSREIIIKLLVMLISIELISSLLIIPLRTEVVIFSLITMVVCFFVFMAISNIHKYSR